MSSKNVLPGDKIAYIEEYESGYNTFDDGESVRASAVGTSQLSKTERVASVDNPNILSIPKPGDIVIGTVEAVMSSMLAVLIKYINGKLIMSQVECVCPTRHIRMKNIALVKDIMRLKIVSHLNGTIHATIDEPELGVLYTKCRRCGSEVMLMRDTTKCRECGWIDDRKLASDFLKANFIKFRD